MSSGPEPLSLSVRKGVRLSVHRYPPSRPARDTPVVLVHGLLSSSDIFDVPGVPEASLARFFQAAGFVTYTFDVRGAGGSITDTWAFGLREFAFEDLAGVVKLALARDEAARAVLVGHSLGGLAIYLLLAALSSEDVHEVPGLEAGQIAAVATLGSPAGFSPDMEPWRTFAQTGSALFDRLDPNGDGRIERVDWTRSSVTIPVFDSLTLPASLVGAAESLAARSHLVSWLLLILPLRSLLYDQSDFDAATFARVLSSRTIDRGSLALVREVFDAATGDGKVRVPVASNGEIVLPDHLASLGGIPLLTVASEDDRLVPEQDVAWIHEYHRGTSLLAGRDLGMTCGHAGYLFKDGLRESMRVRMLKFINANLSGS